jgi:hypothetical protein
MILLKRERDRRELAELRYLYGGSCEAGGPECTGRVEALHHIEPRRTGGNDRANILAICNADHAWIHAHPQQARAAGWLGSSLGTIQTPTRRPT